MVKLRSLPFLLASLLLCACGGGTEPGLPSGVDCSGTCVALASARSASAVLAGDQLFYGDDSVGGGVFSVPAAGGPSSRLASVDHVYAVAVSGTTLAWTTEDANTGTGDIWTATTSGDAATRLVQGEQTPLSVATDGTTVFWADRDADSVWSVPAAGGTPQKLLSFAHPLALTVEAQSLYVSGGGGFVRVDKDGGNPLVLRSSPALWHAVGTTHLYYVDQSSDVLQLPLGGGDPVTLTTADTKSQSEHVTVAGGYVYWDAVNVGSIWRVPESGGTTELIASGFSSFASLVADGTSAYFTLPADSLVARITP
jgi:hypothetical protein